MKIKVKSLPYEKVLSLPGERRKKPLRPSWFFRTLLKTLSAGELSCAMNAMSNRLRGLPDDFNLQCMQSLKAMTPDDLAGYTDIVRKLVEEGGRATFGGAAAINADAELFDSILNPFGAQD